MDEILTPEQWYELQGRIRKLYPQLTDAELQYHEANEKDLMAMVEFSLRKSKEVLNEIIAKQYFPFPLKYYWRFRRHNHLSHGI